jgi:hypothetical protein
MKIQFISQIPGNYKEKRKAHLHHVPFWLEKLGYTVDIIEKKNWIYFYLRYMKFKPDVLIASGLIGFLPIFFKKLGLIRKPIIYYWGDFFLEAMGNKWGVDKCAYVEFYCVKNANLITTPSKFLEKVAKNIGKEVIYIPHGVIDGLDDIKESSLKEIGINKKLVKFIYMGDICQYKKVDKLIEAVRNEDCILYIIGKLYDDIKLNNLPKNVIYLDEMPHEKVLSYLKSCDIGVITGDQDSTLRMFEYLALGKPILSYKGRINYILDNRYNSLTVDDLKEGVKELIKNPVLRKNLMLNVKKFKVRSWKSIGKEYDKIIKIIKNNG